MIVIGVSDNPLRERLLRTETLTLENAINIGQASEATKQQAMTLSRPHAGNQNNVDELRTKSNNTRRPRQQSTSTSASSQARSNCKYCGDIHQRGKCPAYGKTCSKCHKLNHFASVYLSTSRSVHYTTEGHEGHDYEIASDANNIFIGTLSTEVTDNSVNTANITKDGNRDWIISLRSNESVTRFKIDIGAQANVIPMATIEKLATRPHIEKTNTTLTAYNGMNIPVVGKCTLDIQHNNQTHAIPFVVANTTSPPLIGLQTSIDLNLIKRVWTINAKTPNFIQEYKDVFGELGCLKGEHHISIDPNVTPVVHPPRKIPLSLMEHLKAELERMCKLDVIEKVDEPTDWVSSMVVVEKDNGQLRICLDLKDLNTAIKRHHYPMPTVDEVLSKLGGCNYPYLQSLTHPARLAFGIHSAAEVFQKKVAEIIDGVPNAANDQDDIIVFGRNKEQHDKALKDILDRVRESGLKLNEKKCRFGVSETTLGHVITAAGIKPDPRKIEAIINMPTPSNKVEIQRFLGMVTYLGKFLPRLSDETAPLRQLLEKDVVWHFETKHRQAIENRKHLVTSSPVLTYFNPKHAIRITADASKSGLGAVLEQLEENTWKPVAYASRAMTQSEQNYAQIEKETLAIVFACERFHEYTYGRPITVRSDHKPLKAIFSKPLCRAPPRLQRLLLRLQRYELSIDYTPGTDIPVADALSRAYLESKPTPEISEEDMNCHVHSALHNLPVSDSKLLEFKLETAKDPTLQELKNIVVNGLPSNKQRIPDAVKPYLTFIDEISEVEGILLRTNRIIVPSSMRCEMKARIHEGHLVIERCKTRAREVIFWPGMATEISEMISRCETCLESRKRQQREPLMPLPPAHHAWSRVACDLFYMNGKDYLLIVDYHTSFPEVSLLSETTSAGIIKHTK
ncbi:uncharacterized protein K02A2.6-like [Xenia sp. Carnegie-2017]|uniref:uncharacterized protein K02A2.6-like n=1 Tax=Xenia sp. Carnegie-2017 TaxID=2897299 RepID=UPI001F03CA11|nr:uncharacterized protein K02A2.6-like [Xenia sp. Carnegie-2017]